MEDLKLPKEVSEKFKLKDIEVGSYDFEEFGIVHLHQLTLAQAEALVEKKFPFLIPKPKQVAPAAAAVAS